MGGQNRIVVDYGDMDDLVLLGAVEIVSGNVLPPDDNHIGWSGPSAQIFPYLSLREVIASPPRKNAEGFVIRSLATGAMQKWKQIDYINLHRIVTGLSEKTVWEALANGTYEDLLEKVPDEFHAWLRATERKFGEQFADEQNEAHNYCHLVSESLPLNYERKEFALAVVALVPGEYRSYMFAIEDGKLIDDMIWKRIKPVGATPMKIVSEDTA